MDLKSDFAFVPQPPLAPFDKVPAGAPLPSAGIWSPQPHPAPVEPVARPEADPMPGGASPDAGGGAAGGQAAPAPAATSPALGGGLDPGPGPSGGTRPSPDTPSPPPIVPSGDGAPTSVQPAVRPADEVKVATSLGPLAALPGRWTGTGLNVIWRPSNRTGSDHFLEINLTNDDIEFVAIPGDIPNRGLFQGDISMQGMRYLQQTQDATTGQGLHIEPGLWALVPATVNPSEPETVVRMASIPHGTTVLAQGVASTSPGMPAIEAVSIAPFFIATPNQPLRFDEADLLKVSQFRTAPDRLAGVEQSMLDDPNSLLRSALSGSEVRSATRINVSSAPVPVLGGGVSNTAFLNGGVSGPNAQAALVTSSFWIEEVVDPRGGPEFLQLQYSQTVMLNFAGLSWPHVTVATLRKVV